MVEESRRTRARRVMSSALLNSPSRGKARRIAILTTTSLTTSMNPADAHSTAAAYDVALTKLLRKTDRQGGSTWHTQKAARTAASAPNVVDTKVIIAAPSGPQRGITGKYPAKAMSGSGPVTASVSRGRFAAIRTAVATETWSSARAANVSHDRNGPLGPKALPYTSGTIDRKSVV